MNQNEPHLATRMHTHSHVKEIIDHISLNEYDMNKFRMAWEGFLFF